MPERLRAIPLAAGWLLLVSSLYGQSVSGRVLDSVSGQPLAGVSLRLSSKDAGTATSDAQGRFRFDSVKLGRYTLLASKDGYAPVSYGAGGKLIVASERGIADLEVRLVPPSAIQGKVIDRDGNPLAGVAIAFGFVNLYGVPPVMEPVAVQTNGRGEFRVARMRAGRYYVQAIPVRPGASLPAYYPSAGAFGEAQPVLVAPGQEASGIRITLRQRPVFALRGKIMGAVPADLELLLLPKSDESGPRFGKSYRQLISLHVAGSRTIRSDGSFELTGVERGTYMLEAVARHGQESRGRATVVVTDRNVENLVLPLERLVQLSVRIQPDSKLTDAYCYVNAYPVTGDPSLVTIMGKTGADGVFTSEPSTAGVYALSTRCGPEGWVVQSIRTAGVDQPDVLDAGIALTESSPVTAVNLILTGETGVVTTTVKEDDKPAPERWVTLIPDPPSPGKAVLERSGWTDEDGSLILRGVVPGEYRLYAWREAAIAASSVNPFFLGRYASQSVKVTVRAGTATPVETKTIEP